MRFDVVQFSPFSGINKSGIATFFVELLPFLNVIIVLFYKVIEENSPF